MDVSLRLALATSKAAKLASKNYNVKKILLQQVSFLVSI